jgi:hypothetical protein
MAVGQHEAIRRDDDAGAHAAGAAVFVVYFNAHDRRADGIGHGRHCVRICVEDLGIRGGRCRHLADVPDTGRRCKIEHWDFGALRTAKDVGMDSPKWKMLLRFPALRSN